jgi:restriction endonuclease
MVTIHSRGLLDQKQFEVLWERFSERLRLIESFQEDTLYQVSFAELRHELEVAATQAPVIR